jgi:LAGLIDADG DNA endonuclease family
MKNKMNKQQLIGLNPNSRLIKEYKNSLTSLSNIQLETSIGLMLGDASLQTQNKGLNYRLKFEWSNKNKPYLYHVFNIFDQWVLSNPHLKSRISPKGNLIINLAFQTISHEAFNPLANLFLINNQKGITDSLIQDHLTERGLAYWFMDDGGKLDYNKNSKNKSLVLNTQSFKEEEVIKLSNGLETKFKLDCSIRSNKGKKIIVIHNNSYPLFYELVNPYIIPEMKYKLP